MSFVMLCTDIFLLFLFKSSLKKKSNFVFQNKGADRLLYTGNLFYDSIDIEIQTIS